MTRPMWTPALAQKAVRVAKRTAVEAGRMLLARRARRPRIEYKGAINLVTASDRASQALIQRRLGEAFPGHDVLSEEDLDTGGGSAYRWIVDPLDGTTNYAHGFPNWCVSIALEVEGVLRVGAVFNPNLDELFWAVRGGGAWLGDRRIRVSGANSLGKALLATGFPYDLRERPDAHFERFTSFCMTAQAVRRAGAAALDLCYVGAGRFDGFWESRLHPWDVAAGAVIVEEAGGRLTAYDGSPFDVMAREIVASNGRVHGEMLALLARVEKARACAAGAERPGTRPRSACRRAT